MNAVGPGIANAHRPRGGPFAELIERIVHDSSALDGFAFAYSELGTEARRGLIRAVIQDVADPCEALCALLAIECDPVLAAELAGLLQRHSRREIFATLERRPGGGEACLVRSGLGFAGELLRIAWNNHEIHSIEIESTIAMKCLAPAAQSPVSAVVEAVTPLLWRHIRSGGTLPEGVERFAGFFSVA